MSAAPEKVSEAPVISIRLPSAVQAELERRALDNFRSRNAEVVAILCREFGITVPECRPYRAWATEKVVRGVPHGQ